MELAFNLNFFVCLISNRHNIDVTIADRNPAQQRRDAADRGQRGEAAGGAVVEAVIRSAELIVQTDPHDVVGEM
jgi:hypothetical protein